MRSILFLLMFAGGEIYATCAQDLSPIEIAIDRVNGPAGSYTRAARQALDESRRALRGVLRTPSDRRDFQNTVAATDSIFLRLSRELTAMSAISSLVDVPDSLRDEKNVVSPEWSAFLVELGQNPSLYRALERVEGLRGDEEELRLAFLRRLRDNGAHLTPRAHREISRVKNEASPILTAYWRSIDTDASEITLNKADLAGMDDLPEASEVSLPLKSLATVKAALARVHDAKTRERIYLAFRGRLPENGERMLALTKANARVAELKGKQNLLDLTADERSIAGSPAAIETLLRRMADGLRKPVREHLARLADLKRADGLTEDLRPWDVDYYERKLSEGNQAVQGTEDAGEAFPTDQVFGRVTGLLARLFRLDFREMADAKTWDPSVRVVEVYDRRARRSLGVLYVDLFSRKGKPTNGAYVASLVHREWNTKRTPVAILSTNWGEVGNKPYLLHADVFTLLHEFGHALHFLFNSSKALATTFNTFPKDFIEMPSTSLEYLAKDPEALVEISGGYLTMDSARRLAGNSLGFQVSRGDLYSSTYGLNTVFLALLDLEIQKAGPSLNSVADLHAIYRREFIAFYGMDPGPDDRFVQNFTHIADGYAGNYWSYLMARTVAANVSERLRELGGVTNSRALGLWRQQTLRQPQHSRTANEILESFLGHGLSAEPLLREQGLL